MDENVIVMFTLVSLSFYFFDYCLLLNCKDTAFAMQFGFLLSIIVKINN